MIRPELLSNPALNAHALFFDDVHKNLVLATDAAGNPAGKYVPIPAGVQVLPNGDVQFAYYAPEASRVQVAGIGGGFSNERRELSRGEDGWWYAIVSGIDSGFHYHEYFVDGTRALNPYAPYGYGCGRVINYFELPDKYSNFYLYQEVPHGTVRMDYYLSSVTGRIRNCWVYTPPGYEDGTQRYPVLYLQHGSGESETGWLWQGKINHIADNLIANGGCKPMIIVMNDGYAFPVGCTDPELAHNAITPVLVEDCIPFIDNKYRTLADRHHRAMAGLSMGGAQAQRTVFAHPELFANLGVLSMWCMFDESTQTRLQNPEQFNRDFDLLFYSSGEQEDPLCEGNHETLAELRKQGIRSVYYTTPGYHDWTVWRWSARELLTQLFHTEKRED